MTANSGQPGPRQPGDLREALELLRSEDPRQRALAAKTLGRQGGNASAAVPELLCALTDADPMVRSVVADALGRLGAPDALEPLARALSDPVVPVRFWAAEALGRLGGDSPQVRAALEAASASGEPHVVAAARRALARREGSGRGNAQGEPSGGP